jgi:hypothetical protein
MSDPHAPYRALRNTDRLIAEGQYRLERQQHHLDWLHEQQCDAEEAVHALHTLEAELASLRNERDALIRSLAQPPVIH